jgi:hypothetical protein
MTVNERLNSNDIRLLLNQLGINWDKKKPDENGWITINSPLREDKNPSFGLNINTGAFRDHGNGDSGDIVILIENMKKVDRNEVIHWIDKQVSIYNSNDYSNGREPKGPARQSKIFWTPERMLLLTEAQRRLQEEPDHVVVQQAYNYDQLAYDTLSFYGCGIINKYGHDWMAIPYETGCQLYRRANEQKVIATLKGSSPSSCFFGTRRLEEGRQALLIAKSPREAMLFHQTYPDGPNIVGLATGEISKLSRKQITWLKGEIRTGSYSNIFVLMDCDTNAAYKTAKSLTTGVKSIAEHKEVSLFNISNTTGGNSKDFTDLIQSGLDEDTFKQLYQQREIINSETQSITSKNDLDISPDDLRLPERLRDKLPSAIQDYLTYSSPLSDVPNEFLITPFLAITGSAIGRRRYVEVGGMTIYPTIWTVLFAGSSTLRKSTALTLAKKPFKPIMERFKDQYDRDMVRWEQEKELYEDSDQEFNDPEPIKRTLYCPDGFSDLTFWESLRDNGSLTSMPSEFTALWSELTRPRNSMRDLALSIFDAEDSIRRTTKNAGDIELENPVWCMAGATTLPNFQRTLTSNERASGLLQRILPICMEERTKEFRALTELQKPNSRLYNRIINITDQLVEINARPVIISLEAEQIFTEWSHNLNRKAESLSERLPDIGGYISRLNVYGLKFALIFQQLDQPDEDISLRNMEAAIELSEWVLHHIIYMLDRNYIFNRNYADRVKIRELIERQSNNIMSRTDLMNMSNFDKDQLDKAINSDIESGIIEEIKTDTGGRPRIEYKLLN